MRQEEVASLQSEEGRGRRFAPDGRVKRKEERVKREGEKEGGLSSPP